MGRLIEVDREAPGQIGGTLIENGIGAIERRVNPYVLEFDKNGCPNFEVERETELGEAEYQGMMSIFNLGEKYNYIFWLSPPGGRSPYTEGRLVVAKKTGEGVFECRGVPVLVNAEEMLFMARRLEEWSREVGIFDVEKLREKAIGVDIGNRNLWDFCEEVFGMTEVWETIRKGEDVKMKKEAVALVEVGMVEIRRRFGQLDGSNSIVAGAWLENFVARNGFEIRGGNHGVTNSSLLGGRSVFDRIYNGEKITKIDSQGNILTYCEQCGTWYTGRSCPICNKDNLN